LRKFRREYRNTFFKGAACVLLRVPLKEVNLLQKRVDSFRVGEEALIQAVNIPLEEDIAKVEDNGCDLILHRFILSDSFRSGIIPHLEKPTLLLEK
jgi:hypothetical protein